MALKFCNQDVVHIEKFVQRLADNMTADGQVPWKFTETWSGAAVPHYKYRTSPVVDANAQFLILLEWLYDTRSKTVQRLYPCPSGLSVVGTVYEGRHVLRAAREFVGDQSRAYRVRVGLQCLGVPVDPVDGIDLYDSKGQNTAKIDGTHPHAVCDKDAKQSVHDSGSDASHIGRVLEHGAGPFLEIF